ARAIVGDLDQRAFAPIASWQQVGAVAQRHASERLQAAPDSRTRCRALRGQGDDKKQPVRLWIEDHVATITFMSRKLQPMSISSQSPRRRLVAIAVCGVLAVAAGDAGAERPALREVGRIELPGVEGRL